MYFAISTHAILFIGYSKMFCLRDLRPSEILTYFLLGVKAEKLQHLFCRKLHTCSVLKSMVGVFHRNKFDKIIISEMLYSLERNYFILCTL